MMTQTGGPQEDSLLKYILLIFVLSVPIWLVGGGRLPLPMNLPVSALMSLLPGTAAAILLYQRHGSQGVKDLLKKTFDYPKIPDKIWLVPALLLNPLIFLLSYAVMVWTRQPLPDPQVPLLLAPVYFVMFFLFAATEELGWSGYAADRAQNRWGALKAAVILGLVWAVWHIIPDIQAHHPPKWIFWHRLGTVLIRILLVWLYNNTGKSVFATILYHDTNNVSWSLFPNNGSHYNPTVTTSITLLVVGLVLLVWGPKTLARGSRIRVSADMK